MTEHLDAGLNTEQPLFRRRQQIAAWQEIAGNRLRVSAVEKPARPERFDSESVPAGGIAASLVITIFRLPHLR